MHLLYLDESGCAGDASQQFFVLAGVAVFERTGHWIEQDLNAIAKRFAPNDPYSVELHGSPMRSGRDGWKAHPLKDRLAAMKDTLLAAATRPRKDVRFFAAVIRKASLHGNDPVEHAFEQITSRFDLFLSRLHAKHGDTHRGIIILDKSSTERRIQTLAREFKYSGHTWGKTRNYAEVPLFLDSRASRLIQLADMAAYAVFRKFEHSDDSFFDAIKNCFDSEGGVAHGLYLKT